MKCSSFGLRLLSLLAFLVIGTGVVSAEDQPAQEVGVDLVFDLEQGTALSGVAVDFVKLSSVPLVAVDLSQDLGSYHNPEKSLQSRRKRRPAIDRNKGSPFRDCPNMKPPNC